MNKMESIGFRIRRVRALTGLSQEEFATQVGVSRSVLSQIEIDKIRPSLDLLSAISKLYDVPYNWLIEGDPSPDEMNDKMYPPSFESRINAADKNHSINLPDGNLMSKLDKSKAFEDDEIKRAKSLLLPFSQGKTKYKYRMPKMAAFKISSEASDGDGSIWLVKEYMYNDYFNLSKYGYLEKLADQIQLPAESLHPKYQYRAFEVPDNRMSPLLERGDLLIGYQQNDPRDLVLLSLYVLAMEHKVVFGVLTGITDTHYLISHNPVNDYQVEYRKDEIMEFWLVDKVLNDNFTSRFRQAQMLMMQANPMARNIQKG
jgi:transcriptional regulator with XRE-family HTH domain